jgi:cell filamentation protein
LANRLGIARVRDMQIAETRALLQLTNDLLGEVGETQRFTVDDLCRWHVRWLGGIYDWAGCHRQVNMSKDGFPFAAARLIPRLMADYGRTVLAPHTPCAGMSEADLIRALAVTHAEFILVHPFREGNGRLVRLLNTLMALQAGWPPLDFDGIRGLAKRRYIAAIHAAQGNDYGPLEQTFAAVLRRTLRTATSFARGVR